MPKSDSFFLVEAAWLRAAACLCVVLIHVTANPLYFSAPGSAAQLGFLIANQFTRFAVPAFIFLSGLTLGWRYLGQNADFFYRTFLVRRFYTVFLPYAAWSTIYTLSTLSALGGPWELTTVLKRIGYELLVGDASYHLYFVVLICQFYLLFPLFLYPLRKLPFWNWWLGFGLFYQLLACILNYYYISATGNPYIDLIIGRLDRNFLLWSGYFLCGLAFGANWLRIQPWISRNGKYLLGPALLAWLLLVIEFLHALAAGRPFGGAVSSMKPLVAVYTFTAIPFILWCGARCRSHASLNKLLLGLSRHSYGIFLSHPVVIAALQRIPFWSENMFSPAAAILMYLAAVFLPYLLLTGFDRIRVARSSP